MPADSGQTCNLPAVPVGPLPASYSSGALTISVNPSGPAASATEYTGNVLLGTSAGPLASVPVTLRVSSQSISPTCDINGNGTVTVADVQLEINEALGTAPGGNDLNEDGVVNAVDVQIVINAVLNLGCTAF